ncbi:MAG: bifunctional diaminohydroxyphosphoribosylaminopyrimidine deaminase/5-amino-6-(5-phosphoribosylamino)uracil reductase RibD [Candidatus Cloacimonetes bacterium]|nr:bifunctional diaminohydroxyphosphoribosylaminopyrimidine deaminase/5-amino-6-(5-phosphoribosylamino)uracil reductase RibD [Candidatus Cloacimonadota bacterium]
MYKKFMKRALELAEEFRGKTSPNPMVGAVLVKDGRIIGEGAHQKAGQPHAEGNAITNATEDVAGSTLYVTLEPCSHHGKTPPCTDLIIKSGISKVYIAMQDPNQLVNGNGIRKLREHGIEVEVGLMEKEAALLNEVFICNMRHKRAFVALKAALSLDGKIASASGDSKWITNEESRLEGHGLRARYDAILVGRNTFLKDNPSLNIRHGITGYTEPQKIILLEEMSLSKDQLAQSNTYNTLTDNKLYIALPDTGSNRSRAERVRLTNLEYIFFSSFEELAYHLYQIGIMSVLVEGGSSVYNSFLTNGIVDKLYLFYAPILLGNEGLGWSGNMGIDKVENAVRFKIIESKSLSDNTLVICYPQGR